MRRGITLRVGVIERNRKFRELLRKRTSYFQRRLRRDDIGIVTDDPGKERRDQIHAEKDQGMRSEIGKIDTSRLTHVVDRITEECRCHDLQSAAQDRRKDEKDEREFRGIGKTQKGCQILHGDTGLAVRHFRRVRIQIRHSA